MRQGYYTNPAEKKLEIFPDFSGGLNTVTSNINLKNNELVNLENIDLGERGSLARRNGIVNHIDTSLYQGKAQGYFNLNKSDGSKHEIVAINGKLYKGGTQITLDTDSTFTFQTTRPIEAVQFGEVLYIATGTKFLKYDGTTLSEVLPYAPDPLEALYLGLNGLAANPSNFMSNGVSTTLQNKGLTASKRYGVVNQVTTFQVYYSKPDTMSIEIQFEYRKKGTETWIVGQSYSATETWNFIPTEIGEYEVQTKIREVGTTTDKLYFLPSYKCTETDENIEFDTSTIHSCNRIVLHWNRIILYGDTSNTDVIYVSHLENPSYFPTINSLIFENDRKEGITSIVKYRDALVVFTPSTIQGLFGTSPYDFSRTVFNTDIGCIAPFSTAVVGNNVAFLSREGIYILKSISISDSRMNVEKIDTNIDDLIPRSTKANAIQFDNQYHICFPDEQLRFRFYTLQGVWTKDKSSKMSFERMYAKDGVLYGQNISTGSISKFDNNTWDDEGEIYETIIETKMFDFGVPYHWKKLKELQLVVGNTKLGDVRYETHVYADAKNVLSPDTSKAVVNNDGSVTWVKSSEPNVTSDAGTVLGEWDLGLSAFGNVETSIHQLRINGKCQATKVILKNKQALPTKLLGLAYIFKTKKP